MFYKFPSTPYIFIDSTLQKKEKNFLSDAEIEEFLSNKITVEEKIDGANLGISFDCEGNISLQNRGEILHAPFYGQWKMLNQWINIHEDELFDILGERYILYGEWCYACHSIEYDKLPDWFLAFDLFDKEKGKFLSVKNRDEKISRTKICLVPKLGYGRWTRDELKYFFSVSKVGSDMCEGIYLRYDSDAWLVRRAKMVRPEFRQQIEEHWSRKPIKRNQICVKY